MAAKIQFSIVTPEKTVHQAEVDSVRVTTTLGEIEILSQHIPLVAELKPGSVAITDDGAERLIAVSTGFVEVRPDNSVIVLADTADRAEDLDLAAIEKAQEAAKQVMEEKQNVDEEAYAHAAASLERELARARVVRKQTRH
ncbi:ATP synthase F1 subunit epsilon [Candidatus Uhrbacteria bacterium CG10_big_fil_rev_8_21_14_0_10_50_16]|uniref:ATP synthase epsilon chain n=1 Tax=Candidatus Uhrbacteria bacterium CG10_big_fil_rev_8_21_14_0_10_50_16 TaxID=1975039 RepID=A0A2H0RN35_9BACT|nr:MAG: ATP synthase F1 subunit epsilon [Candidatus Uhrbacteria bacterium CG10_big_fil_rev_8_21_14_0_10_50_16]